jgi:hypothetical protein
MLGNIDPMPSIGRKSKPLVRVISSTNAVAPTRERVESRAQPRVAFGAYLYIFSFFGRRGLEWRRPRRGGNHGKA